MPPRVEAGRTPLIAERVLDLMDELAPRECHLRQRIHNHHRGDVGADALGEAREAIISGPPWLRHAGRRWRPVGREGSTGDRRHRGWLGRYRVTAPWNAAQHNVPVIFVIVRNGTYDDFLKADGVPALDLPGIDFVAIATG